MHIGNLELNHLALLFLVTSQFKMFATLDGQLLPVFADCALHLQCDLLCGLSLKSAKNALNETSEYKYDAKKVTNTVTQLGSFTILAHTITQERNYHRLRGVSTRTIHS